MCRFFRFWLVKNIVRTRIYVDGYNLYYGCLKNTGYKWLDLFTLFDRFILPRSGSGAHASNISIKYFTAEIHESAANDLDSVNDQRTYHQALRYHRQSEIEIIKGSYNIDKVDSHRVEPAKKLRESTKVKVWKIEEKQSDVNLSVSAVYDALIEDDLEQIVFVTNDTDIVPALSKIKSFNDVLVQEENRKPITIGLVIPARDSNKDRRANKDLDDLSDWTVHYIKSSELNDSQLPMRITSGRKPATRPISWFKNSTKVDYIYQALLGVEKSPSKVWRWLESSKPNVDGLPNLGKLPIEMLDCEKEIEDVIAHVDAYVKYKNSF